MRLLIASLIIVFSACSQPSQRAEADNVAANIATSPISRCMNMGNALDSPRVEGAWGYIIRRDDLEMLKSEGFDTVRIPIRWSDHAAMAPPYTVSEAFFTRVDEVIGWTEQIGLNAIINVHHYEGLSRDPDIHEPRLEAIWQQVADRYRDHPDSLIFETINEPHSEMSIQRTDALNARLLKMIRNTDPDRWVILGTAQWGNLEGLIKSEPVYDPRAILTYHDYNPFAFTHQGAFWTEPPLPTGVTWGSAADFAAMASTLDKALKVQNRDRMPVFVGEFGVYEGVPIEQRARWIRGLRQAMETRGIGWCHWDFATTLKAYDLEQNAWLPEIHDALLAD